MAKRESLKDRVVRCRELEALLGISRTTLWRWERKGLLPPRRHYGPNVVGWPASVIEEWKESKDQ